MRKRPTKEDRARLMDELQLTLEALGEEMEALAPHLLPLPPTWAVVKHRALTKLARDAGEMLYAMQDAEEATVH
jgi:hypothetical protein